MSITCDIFIPFLRWFHNDVDIWRDNHDVEGWIDLDKSSKWLEILDHLLLNEKISKETYDQLRSSQKEVNLPPKCMLAVLRLFDDLEMFKAIITSDIPNYLSIRHSAVAKILCGFVDAFGVGLSSMMKGSYESKLATMIGMWSTNLSKERWFNWRKFSNYFQQLKKQQRKCRCTTV